jgi:PKD repeat protein
MTVLTLYNPTICIGGNALVVGQASGGSQPYYFHWEGTNGEVNNNHQFYTSPLITTRYNLTVTDDNGCTVGGHYSTVYVNPPISIDYVVNSVNNVCMGDSAYVELDIQGGNGGPYIIRNQYGQIVASPMYVSPTQTTDYIFVVEDLCETPIATDSLTIYVHPLPSIDFTADVIEGCPGQVITFTSMDTVTTHFILGFGDDFLHL